MNPFPLVVAELRRHRLGASAVVALIALAVALGVALGAQESALRRASARAADRFDLVVGAPGSPTQLVLTTVYLQPVALDLLPADVLIRLQKLPGVAAIAPVAVTDSYQGYPVVGTTAEFATDGGRIAIAAGRRFARDDEALVGSDVALAVGDHLRPSHGAPAENVLESHEHDTAFTVVGHLARTGTPWDRAIIVPLEGVWAMHGASTTATASLGPPWAADHAGPTPAIVIKPVSVAAAYALRSSLRGNGTVAVFPAEVLTQLYAVLGNVGEVIAALSLAFDLLILAAVLLVVVAVLAARRPSLGALRALGAPPAFVLATVWLQGAVLVAAGVVIGLLLGSILALGLGSVLGSRMGIAIAALPGWREFGLAAVLLVAGSLLAALPSLATLRMPVRRLLQES